MRVLLVHNYYQQPGGEDQVFQLEAELLQKAGFHIETFCVTNNDLQDGSPIKLAMQTLWNSEAALQVSQAAKRAKAEVVHFHNTFPMLSPAVYSAARQTGAATVQTLHNYRLLCANALLYRDGHVCLDCVGRTPIPAVIHRCYRDSLGASGVTAALQVAHRLRGTYQRDIDAYIALTDFARETVVRAGIVPGERVHVVANALANDPGPGPGGEGALFVGRLDPAKGLRTMLNAWEALGKTIPLTIIGDGPLAGEVAEAAERIPGVKWLGRCPRDEVLAAMKQARCLVFPSEWYEGLPMTIIEAFAVGLPVIGSQIGSITELIEPGVTGERFNPGDQQSLIDAVQRFLAQDNRAMRIACRNTFLESYTGEQHVTNLRNVYLSALSQRNQGA